jgi:UDP-N-acetylglucosamine--N-acetylmuramyl-(pentapeptide) pyrophosphoryl-undecaprenol N-acetylglucosamine transferase
MEAELIQRTGIPFSAIPAAGLHGVGIRALPGNLMRMLQGIFSSVNILREYRPDVLFFTGGYLAVPMAIAGFTLPKLVFVPDIEPGLASKFLSLFSDRISLPVEEARKYYQAQKKLMVTGYPLRKELSEWKRPESIKFFNLSSTQPILLVAGGSKGARSINRAVLNHLSTLLERTQIIHLSGSLDWNLVEQVVGTLPANLAARYRPYPYMHEMGAAFAAADLVLSRAGASILGEYPYFGLPAVLVPYPHAWRYQRINAEYLVAHGAAMILQEDQLDEKLPLLLPELLQATERLNQMSASMRSLSRPDAAERIAGQIMELAGSRS